MAAENFFSRWSQRKQQADDGGASDEQLGHASDQETAAAQSAVQMTPAVAQELTATDVGKLTLESDYAVFMGKEVDATIRRSAMKKLFFNPQLSVMDGLDIYISDYNKTTLIPAAMLSALEQAKSFLIPIEEPALEPSTSLYADSSGETEHATEPELTNDDVDANQEAQESDATQTPSGMPESVAAIASSEDEQSHAVPAATTPDYISESIQAKDFPSPDECPPCDAADSLAMRKGQDT